VFEIYADWGGKPRGGLMSSPLVLEKGSGNTNVNTQKNIKKIMDCGR
jgi:hypothetical protein